MTNPPIGSSIGSSPTKRLLFHAALILGGCLKPESINSSRPLSTPLQDSDQSEVYEDPATHFLATGELGGGCGIHPDLIESQNFVALNVQNTPNDYSTWLPRPHHDAATKGIWDNGKNCGRWVRVTLSDDCADGHVSGRKDEPKCARFQGDDKNGATADFVVTDSCQDDNRWCRDYPYHLDLSTASLKTFVKDGKNVGDLSQNWRNRKVQWKFIESPQKRPVEIHFVRNAQLFWATIGITHLRNGIHGVRYQDRQGNWASAAMNGDNGQTYQINAKDDDGNFAIKIVDAQGREEPTVYEFRFPCQEICSAPYTKVTYTTRGDGDDRGPGADEDTADAGGAQAPGTPSGPPPPSPKQPGDSSPPPPPTPPAPPQKQQPSPRAGDQKTLEANLKPQSQWDTGFCVEVEVFHQESRTTQSWSVEVQIPTGQLQNSWNLALGSLGGGRWRITPTESWAKAVEPGQRVAGMGFCVAGPSFAQGSPRVLGTTVSF